MKKIYKVYWGNLSLKMQMIICILFVSIGALITSTILYYKFVREYVEEKNERYTYDVTKQLSRTLEEFLSQIDVMTKEIAYGNQIQSVLHGESGASAEEIYSYLVGMVRMVGGVDSATVFDLEGKGYYGYKYGKINLFYNMTEQPWFSELENGERSFCYMPDQEQNLILNDEQYLHYIRVIRSVKSLKPIGVLVCQVNMKKLESLLNDLNMDFGIVDKTGNVLVKNSRYDSSVYQMLAEKYGEGEDIEYFHQDREKSYYVTIMRMERNGWNVISTIDEEEMLSGISVLYKNSLLVMVLIIIAIVGLSCFFLQSILQSFQSLLSGAEEIDKGNFDYHITANTNKEVQILAERFHRMSMHLKESFQSIQEQEKQKRKLEMEALSYQITPHFLYNTLSGVKYMAIIQKASGIETIIDSLVFMLQKTFRKTSEYITLREELELVKAYLKIMNIRYMNQLEVSIDVDEKLLSCICIHLMIQPIIENAVFYSSDEAGSKRKIKLSIHQEGENICIEVWNDGKAMDKEKLRILLDDTVPVKSIGLRNINHRIQLYFGKEYGVALTSEEGQGTKTIVRIPYWTEEKHDYGIDCR